MDLGKIPTLVVGLIVAILIVTVVAIPIIDSTQDGLLVEQTNTSQRYSAIDTTDKVTISYESAGTGFLIDGVAIGDIITNDSTSVLIIISSSLILRSGFSSGSVNSAMLYSPELNTENKQLAFPTNSKIVFENGTWEVTIAGELTATGSYDFLMIPSKTGTMGYFDKTPNIKVNSDSKMYIVNTISGFNLTYGSIGSGFEQAFSYDSTGAATPIQISPVYTDNDDLTYTITDVKGLSNSWGSLIAPLTYKVLPSDNSAVYTVIDIIPILLIVSLLIAIVGTVLIRIQ